MEVVAPDVKEVPSELTLDSIDQALRNESEKSVMLAPFNSSISDFDEEEYKGMEASLIVQRLFEDVATSWRRT